MYNTITFNITGNFQYDIGILGLKKVLDFFNLEYEYDDYSLTVSDSLFKQLGHYFYLYSYCYAPESFITKIFANDKKGLDKSLVSELSQDIHKTVKEQANKDYDEFVAELSVLLDKKLRIKLKDIENKIIKYPAESILNRLHHNRCNPGLKTDKKRFYFDIVNSFQIQAESADENIEDSCDFCYKFKGNPLNRQNFLFALSAINLYWFSNVSKIYICPYCSCLNIFALFGFPPSKSNVTKYLVYSSNLKELETDNNTLALTIEKYIIDYIKHKVKTSQERIDKMFIEIELNNKEPNISFLPFTSELLTFFIENNKLIERLYNNNFVYKGKLAYFDVFKDTLNYFVEGKDLLELVDRYISIVVRLYVVDKHGVIFSIAKALRIIIDLSLRFKKSNRGVKIMGNLNEFEQFGRLVRIKMFQNKSKNAAKNKIISLVSSLRDAVNEDRSRLFEILLQISIYSDVPLSSAMISDLTNKNFNYKEAGLVVALALMSVNNRQQIKETAKEVELDE